MEVGGLKGVVIWFGPGDGIRLSAIAGSWPSHVRPDPKEEGWICLHFERLDFTVCCPVENTLDEAEEVVIMHWIEYAVEDPAKLSGRALRLREAMLRDWEKVPC